MLLAQSIGQMAVDGHIVAVVSHSVGTFPSLTMRSLSFKADYLALAFFIYMHNSLLEAKHIQHLMRCSVSSRCWALLIIIVSLTIFKNAFSDRQDNWETR